jgi:hypothetical protein
MTAEFPDLSTVDLEERRALAAEEQAELAEMGLPELEAERAQREDDLVQCRVLCLSAQIRIVSNRLEALRAEIEQRGHR